MPSRSPICSAAVPGVEIVTPHFFNEFTIRTPKPGAEVIDALADEGVLGGVPASRLFPGEAALDDLIIVAATETQHRRRPRGLCRARSPRCSHDRHDAQIPGPSWASPRTYTGNRGLQIEEPLIFEIGALETSGVDFEEPDAVREPRSAIWSGSDAIGLPGLSEPEAVRHYVRLSQKNYSIDSGIFPLGSCTMKHNPRLNEKMARLPGFGDIHPLQPQKTVQGAIELMADAVRLADQADRHAGGRAVAQGRRAWRALRHDRDPRGARSARRGGDAARRAGARIPRMAPIRRPRRCSASR